MTAESEPRKPTWRESLAEHCERRAKEIRAELAKTVPNSGYRAQEIGTARALEEIALWAWDPENQ